ncbi:MAG: hypothetical protein K6B42_09285 [Clostridia bacterium]|nr:hypothetical protein [Clostridia bacterium]
MISFIENGVQLAVTCVCAVIALYYGVWLKERNWILLGLFYGIFFLGDLYWQLYIIFYSNASPVFYISDYSWYASYLFLLMLLINVNRKNAKNYEFQFRPLFMLIPVFTLGMCIFFTHWGDYISNIVAMVLMTGLIWHAVYGLKTLHDKPGQGSDRRMLFLVTLLFCGTEYAMWVSSCFWMGETIWNVYYWFDILLSVSFVLFIPAVRREVGK